VALTHAELLALANEHVRCEIAQDVDGVLATLEDDTFYDIHPLGVRFSGRDAVRRYYEWLFTSFGPRQVRTELIGTYVGDEGVVFENRLWFSRDDGSVACHDLIGIDVAGTTRLKGEKIFGHPELIEAMVGPLLREAKPIEWLQDDRRLV
jgi:hypothetical protein